MSWIESHQSLARHRKTLRAASLLKTDRHKLIGHLHELWWWGLDNANIDGILVDIMDDEIAAAAGWPAKDAKSFTGALVMAGFIDQAEGQYVLHNWYKYAGKLNVRRETERERAKVRRASSQNTQNVARTSAVRTQDVAEPLLGTVPNLTVPNQPVVPTDADAPDLLPPVLAAWEDATGQLAPRMTAESMDHWIEKASQQWVIDAIVEMNANGAKAWKYVVAILERWMRDGRDVPKVPVNGTGPKPYELPEPWRDHAVLSPEEQERNADEVRRSLAERKARQAVSRE